MVLANASLDIAFHDTMDFLLGIISPSFLIMYNTVSYILSFRRSFNKNYNLNDLAPGLKKNILKDIFFFTAGGAWSHGDPSPPFATQMGHPVDKNNYNEYVKMF